MSQNCALVPKKCPRRKAVSPVIGRVPFKICVTRLVGTPSCVQVRLRSYEAHAILRPGVLPDEWWLLPYPSPNDSQHSPHRMDPARFPGNAARSPSDVTASETIQTAAGGPLKSAKGFDPPARSEVSRSLVAVAEDHQCRVSAITRYVKRKDFFLLHPRTPLLRNLITAQPFPFCFHATISARPCLCRLQ